ncbi:unnamed protein product [Urochloa decumbens]|uniref:Glycosyltransferase N-terminal domain-containing protein n=1 Tax=Urochloa decumbens TaxID=240449 RepID=A0ABC9FLQ2_9POAL
MMAAHVVLFPWPLQGHINPMLHLAAALLDAGLRVTFLHTDHNARRLVLAGALQSHHPRLRVLSIPDGLPDDHPRSAAAGLMDLFHSMRTAGCAAFRALLRAEASSATSCPPVTCVVADGVMPFAIDAAEEAGVPAIAFRTESACGFLCYLCVPRLLQLGETPAASDEPVCGVPGDDAGGAPDPVPVLLTVADTAARCAASRAVILNAAASMEGPALASIAARLQGGHVFAVGPLHARPRPKPAGVGAEAEPAAREDGGCAAWLDGHADRSVVYVNLGSLTVVSAEQLAELLHGLVAAGYPFLCVLRPDMVHEMSSSGGVLREAATAVAGAGGRALVVEWAAHRAVHRALVGHRAVGCFVTHAGWNSALEAAAEGVPAVCWPYFADQQTVSRFVGAVWRNGLDIKDACERDVVERMVREAMESAEIRAAAQAMARQLRLDVAPGGSSAKDLERLVAFITDLSAGQVPSRVDVDNN